MTSAPDIIDLLIAEHAVLRGLSANVSTWSHDGGADYHELSDRLLRHEIAEELVVYPVLNSCCGGAAVAGSRLDDQADIERWLVLLEHQKIGTAEFERISTPLVLDLLTHLDKEEAQVLPILTSRVGRPRRIELGRRFREVTQAAPLHHPHGRVRVATGPTVVDRTTALSVWMRDVAIASGLAG